MVTQVTSFTNTSFNCTVALDHIEWSQKALEGQFRSLIGTNPDDASYRSTFSITATLINLVEQLTKEYIEEGCDLSSLRKVMNLFLTTQLISTASDLFSQHPNGTLLGWE